MYGCESWTIKKAECQRIDAFELWSWITLESALDYKEIKPVNPKEVNPDYSLEGLMLMLKLQCFGHLMWRADSLEKTLTLGKIEGRRGWQRMRSFNGIIDSMDMSLSKLQGMVKDREAWHTAVHRVTKSWMQLSNWTKTTSLFYERLPRRYAILWNPPVYLWPSANASPPSSASVFSVFVIVLASYIKL